MHLAFVDQAQVGFADERRGLQRVVGALVAPVAVRQPPQFFVDQGINSSSAARSPLPQSTSSWVMSGGAGVFTPEAPLLLKLNRHGRTGEKNFVSVIAFYHVSRINWWGSQNSRPSWFPRCPVKRDGQWQMIANHSSQAPATATGENVEQTIKQLVNERAQAIRRADTPAIERLYADDYLSTNALGNVRNKTQISADFKSGVLKTESLVINELSVRVHGETALVTGLQTTKGQDGGRSTSGQARFTQVWERRAGRWQIVANHASRIS